ncbi:ferredoxin [uncultured Mucilaginibacter sp.]|uniref:ferredoxin n=1 Tax=uncultured Mucilaginibacter sp. TaxID=797541 RepID=UPI0025DE5933|nr:ferredoxin [uncultured Mucilaginibacter sp.]
MSKVIQYRNKCIGCGICAELQPELWRMSMKDGKATLLKSTQKKDVFIFVLSHNNNQQTLEVAKACPVNIIKVV